MVCPGCQCKLEPGEEMCPACAAGSRFDDLSAELAARDARIAELERERDEAWAQAKMENERWFRIAKQEIGAVLLAMELTGTSASAVRSTAASKYEAWRPKPTLAPLDNGSNAKGDADGE